VERERADVVVVGAGFGGLGAALALAERGARVVVCEALRYPGGCASTFTRGGRRYEAGATLFAGFDEGQLFARWIARHRLPVETRALDPVVTLRAPGLALPVPPSRDALVETLARWPGAPSAAVRRFFARQKRVADALWALLDDEALLPPFDARALVRHARRLGRYLPLVPLLGEPLARVMERDGVAEAWPLRLFVDAVAQITVQAGAAEAEAPMALATLDYFFRGARHVVGGIGELAWALARAVERLGGRVRTSDAVRRLRREGDCWVVEARRGELVAGAVVANLLPQDVVALLDGDDARRAARELDDVAREVEAGWGAAMLYLTLDENAGGIAPGPHHLQLVADPRRPLVEGNHLFVSLAGAGERGPRTATVSAHVPMATLRGLAERDRAAYVGFVQERMRSTLGALAPEVAGAVTDELTASPRTFARFTRRHQGLVGGVPRRAGLHHYRRLAPPRVLPGLYLVGDSVFPGQSTLATALGGVKAADRITRG